MFCQDPSLTMLAKYGYNVVRVPRTGIEPLEVLGRDRDGIEQLGQLPVIWDTGAKVPDVKDSNVAAEIKTVRTATLKFSLGLRVLEDILGALGATVPRLGFAYGGTRSLQFSFQNILISKVDPFDVGQFLKAGDLQVGNPWVDRYFLDDAADAYVVTEVLKSDSVTVIADSKGSTSVGLDVKAIQNAVGADVKVEAGTGSTSEVTYKGLKHLTFGFKAFLIGYDFNEDGAGEWRIKGVDPGKEGVYLDATQKETQAEMLAERSGRIGRVDLRLRSE